MLGDVRGVVVAAPVGQRLGPAAVGRASDRCARQFDGDPPPLPRRARILACCVRIDRAMIRICVDSNSQLPRSLADRFGIAVVPVIVECARAAGLPAAKAKQIVRATKP